LKEEHRLRVFDNRLLRKIFWLKRDEVTREWRRRLNEKLYDLSSSLNIILLIKSRRMRLAGHVASMGHRRDAYRVLVGKPVGKILLGRPRCRWENNIKMGLQEGGLGGMDWIHLAQDRDKWQAFVNAVINSWVR
jgi:hypothetical protein